MVQAILRSSASQVKPIIFRTFLNRWPTCHKGALSWWITTFNWWFLAKATIASLPAKVPGFAKLATAWKQERKMKSLRWKMQMQTWLVFTYCKQREAWTHISKATDRQSRESEVNNMQTVLGGARQRRICWLLPSEMLRASNLHGCMTGTACTQ